MLLLRVFILILVAAAALGASPVPGFRAPAVPLVTQSPLVNAWSKATGLAEGNPSSWSATEDVDFFSAVRVDGAAYVLMGSTSPRWANGSTLVAATQAGPAVVRATTTSYTFTAGAGRAAQWA
jgi:hypothetical protein